MKISDELRKFIKTYNLNTLQSYELNHIVDRIDAETVELPKDKDGVPIHTGDLVYLDDGRRACVTEIDIKDGCEVIDCWDGSEHVAYHPSGITHKQADSWERIAYDLEAIVPIDDEGDERFRRELADRIRRLAKEGQR